MPSPTRPIDIAGAGPAGLAAAIALARLGHRVRVLERRARPGSRFHDDLQGLENWSTEDDCLGELASLGIEPNWWMQPCPAFDLHAERRRPLTVRGKRPLYYLLRRGAQWEGSLDNALLQQARGLGVEVRFGCAAAPGDVQIYAAGPQGRPMGVARGLTFATEHDNLACLVLSRAIAPGGYAYGLVAGGHATIGVVQVWRFDKLGAHLDQAAEAITRLHGIAIPAEAQRWGGYACHAIPASAVREGARCAGEAAGFQDALFGFGIRMAMVSGALAAHSLVHGTDWDTVWRARLLPALRASQVNRMLQDTIPPAPEALWLALRTARDVPRFMRTLYGYSLGHRALTPLAVRHFRNSDRDPARRRAG